MPRCDRLVTHSVRYRPQFTVSVSLKVVLPPQAAEQLMVVAATTMRLAWLATSGMPVARSLPVGHGRGYNVAVFMVAELALERIRAMPTR